MSPSSKNKRSANASQFLNSFQLLRHGRIEGCVQRNIVGRASVLIGSVLRKHLQSSNGKRKSPAMLDRSPGMKLNFPSTNILSIRCNVTHLKIKSKR